MPRIPETPEAAATYERIGRIMGDLNAIALRCGNARLDPLYTDDEQVAWSDAAVLIDKAINLLDEASCAIPPRS